MNEFDNFIYIFAFIFWMFSKSSLGEAGRIDLMFLRRQIKHMKKYRQELETRLMFHCPETLKND